GLRRYVAALAERTPQDQAWKESFDDASDLQKDYADYLARSSFMTLGKRYDVRGVRPPEVRRLGSAEVHVLWARLGSTLRRDRISADLDEADREAPNPAEVRYWKGLHGLAAGAWDTEIDFLYALERSPD